MTKRIGCVLFLLALASPVQALPTTFDDIEITPWPAPKGISSHGYFEYVFHVANTSEARPHIVSLSIPLEKSFLRDDSIRELRRTVQVGAKEAVLVSLLQPDYPPLGGMDAAVAIDGRRQDRAVQLELNVSLRRRVYYRGSRGLVPFPGEPLILLGTRVKPLPAKDPVPGGPGAGMPGGTTMIAPPARKPSRPPPVVMDPRSPPGKPGLPAHGFQFVNAETWSTNWLAYTRYDGIIVTAAELNAMPAGIQTALWQYVETGGALLVLGRADLRGLSALMGTWPGRAGWRIVRAGFGVCRLSPDDNYDTWDKQHFADLMNDWRNTAGVWAGGQRSTPGANREFPVIDDLGIPAKGLFLLMFLFTLGIGPINILVLTKWKRRIWLLWTTPVLSLFTCVAVFGYMLLSEGWSGQLRSETLTLLDETAHRATTIGWTGVYSPLTPSDGLHFSRETEVVPQRYYVGRDGGARSCTIDWSQDQHFVSGWVEARVPAHFKVRKSELRRERVGLQQEQDGRWSMVNGLGTAIRRFWYADAKGQIHSAQDVGPGARVILTAIEEDSIAPTANVKEILPFTSWMTKFKDLTEHPQRYLRPGLYLAEVDDSPFLEVALPSARTRKLHALIVGFRQQDEKGE